MRKVITTSFENIQVSTSIPVSATMVDPLVTTDRSVNIVITVTLDASANSVDATFSQTADVHIVHTVFTASGLIVNPSSVITIKARVPVWGWVLAKN